MSYESLVDAFSHNQRTQEHLTNLLSSRIDKSAQFSLFLGAGSSVSSGVKTASQMIAEWRRKLFASYKGNDHFDVWLKRQDWYESDEEYSQLFELVYDQPSQRRAYIEKTVKDANPSWGYAYLVSLISRSLFNVVFTTNFDDLLNDACYSFTNSLRPMVCSHDSAVASVRVMSERPKVIKLHGDFLYDSIKNTTSELQSLETNMREKFIEFAKEYGLIVLGYGGTDQSVMDLLDILIRSNSYFRNGIYWCVKKGSIPSQRLKRLLRNDRVFWVEIEGFDEFMADLAVRVQVGLPEAIISPHTAALSRSKHLVDKRLASGHAVLTSAYGDTLEVYTKIQKALEEVGLAGWELGERDHFGELSEMILPCIQCRDLIEKDSIAEAITLAKKILLKDIEGRHGRAAWYMLLKCLLRSKDGCVEARKLLAEAPPVAWQDSTHYLQRSYFCLFLCDATHALAFASRALELNRELIPAKINMAFAYLMLNQSDNLRRELKELDVPEVREHHKAAVYVIKCDIENAIYFLQQSFVLGRYSVDDACADVIFRVLWGHPSFESGMKPFLSTERLKYPYKDACNMSTAERKICSKILSKNNSRVKT